MNVIKIVNYELELDLGDFGYRRALCDGVILSVDGGYQCRITSIRVKDLDFRECIRLIKRMSLNDVEKEIYEKYKIVHNLLGDYIERF